MIAKRFWGALLGVGLGLIGLIACAPRVSPGSPLQTPQAGTPEVVRFQPLAESACLGLSSAVSLTLEVAPVITASVPFTDPLKNGSGEGCRIEYRRPGRQFERVETVAGQLREVFEAQGWREDSRYSAAGPMGMATAYRQGGALALVYVNWSPAPGISCPSDQPVDACELAPEQRVFTIEILTAENPQRARGEVTAAVISAVQEQVARIAGVPVEAVQDVTLEPTDWRDACLELVREDEICVEVITPGFRGTVVIDGQQSEVRADAAVTTVRLIPAAALRARQILGQQLGVDLDDVRVANVEPVDWSDSCLEVARPEWSCAAVVTPGYRVRLETNGQFYDYRTDRTGHRVILVAAPEAPEVEDVGVIWQGETEEGCQLVTLGRDSVAIGACGGPKLYTHYVLPEQAPRLASFVQTYAAFTATTPAGAVQFNGKGVEIATPVEQRMIAEWARMVNFEIQRGRDGTSYGPVLTWHREGGIAGFCDDLVVYSTGEGSASSCKGRPSAELGRRQLEVAQLEQLYNWLDTLKPFEDQQTDSAAADALTIRIIFNGRGPREATRADQRAIQAFAAEIFAQPAAIEPW